MDCIVAAHKTFLYLQQSERLFLSQRLRLNSNIYRMNIATWLPPLNSEPETNRHFDVVPIEFRC